MVSPIILPTINETPPSRLTFLFNLTTSNVTSEDLVSPFTGTFPLVTLWRKSSEKVSNAYQSVAYPEGVSGIRSNLPSRPTFLNILWKWNYLVSVRPNYFIFMWYLRKNGIKSAKRTPIPLYIRTLFQKSWICPCLWVLKHFHLRDLI